MSKNQVSTVDIYTEYVRLRQGGWTSDDAVRQLTPMADELSASERQQLSKLVQAWEARDGQYYNAPAQPDAVDTRNSAGSAAQGNNKNPAIRRIEPKGPQETTI